MTKTTVMQMQEDSERIETGNDIVLNLTDFKKFLEAEYGEENLRTSVTSSIHPEATTWLLVHSAKQGRTLRVSPSKGYPFFEDVQTNTEIPREEIVAIIDSKILLEDDETIFPLLAVARGEVQVYGSRLPTDKYVRLLNQTKAKL